MCTHAVGERAEKGSAAAAHTRELPERGQLPRWDGTRAVPVAGRGKEMGFVFKHLIR